MLSCVNSNVDAGGEKIAEAFKVIVEACLLQSKCNFGITGCAFMLATEFTKPFGFADV
jgi:hypothetical protein